MALLVIFCLLILYNFVKETFKFEKITRISFIVIPIYALIMTVLSIFNEEREWNLLVAIVLILIGIMLGWFQTFSVRVIRTANKDKHGNHIYKYRRGWAYLYGFILVFIVEVAADNILGLRMTFKGFIIELLNEVLRERFKFLPEDGWIIWLLLTVTTSTYTFILLCRYPCIKEAFRRKKVSEN